MPISPPSITLLLTLFLGLNAAVWADAQALSPVKLEPIDHNRATLTIRDAAGVEYIYAPADLEAFRTYRVRTATPWREEAAEFDGVLLADLLQAHGLEDVGEIMVMAENDYAVTIPASVWTLAPVLIATRVNGAAHSRRARGPLQFVIPMAAYQAHPDIITEDHLVWMAARIQPLE